LIQSFLWDSDGIAFKKIKVTTEGTETMKNASPTSTGLGHA
jgi:hypothetical protein